METLAAELGHLEADYQFQTACYAFYVYDHLLTLSDEVEKIWTSRLSLPSLLFYINRYLTHVQFIILQVSFYETSWSSSMCHHFVRFSGATSLCIITAIELVLILRVYALYLGNRKVLSFLLSVLAAAVVVMAACVSQGRPAPHPSNFPGCVMTGSNAFFAFFWAAPLVTDSCIFVLTLWRTIAYRKKHVRMTAIDIIFRDGLIYYIIITFAKCLNVFIYLLATEDLKGLGSSFSRVIASIMISRLQLNLRPPTMGNSTNYAGGRQDGHPSDKNYGIGHGLTVETALTNTLPWKISDAASFEFDYDSDVERGVEGETMNVVDTFFTVANLGETVAGPFSEDEMAGSEHPGLESGMASSFTGVDARHLEPPAKVYMV